MDSITGAGQPAYLGRGWEFPPAFGPGGRDVAMVDGIDDILQSLMIILSTERNERLMRPDFGASLRQFQFEIVDRQLLTAISAAVRDAVTYHEPRISLDTVDTIQDAGEPGLLRIAIGFTVRGSNSRYNLVFPHSVAEATGGERT